MINNIIFDFGDIFINLDKEAIFKELEKYGFKTLTPELDTLAKEYEQGLVTTKDFTAKLLTIFPSANEDQITKAWNSILLDFPLYRLNFIEELAQEKNYRLFLLSNTNELHISHVIKTMGEKNYNRFKNCFEKFYLSHEIQLRKPNATIYEFVLEQNNLKAEETFFIDDTKENTDAAEKLGITCWNLLVGSDDIINIKTKLP
ncbi:putative hydrolase of the HAD superfamily [Maribacter vaceletii]|uniref:Putative hydrolase of the HAD superfamily n=1 Tax=Maribacter vaceletii TaxID=1206816 RepID=A0A495E9M9_9FLAO|nr:HAD-IA family hydrolase [Maribacter vaceletii]RKR13401.1 putative hydrolase of the HAD superfamily [Maribacter vaceletii]